MPCWIIPFKNVHDREIEKRTLNVCSYSQDNLRNLILAVVEFLARLHTGCAQPHQQFESLVEGTIKKQIFDLLSYWLRNSKVPTELPPQSPPGDLWIGFALQPHEKTPRPRKIRGRSVSVGGGQLRTVCVI
ncbi:hypothetical protein, partial [Candidatus Villigracilis saccharophilus]|uniref:hypothetical protein n=1 Tax=Candidatus Villigracilis saccharophilus TaxID=3140684 RepID=UPI0031E71823